MGVSEEPVCLVVLDVQKPQWHIVGGERVEAVSRLHIQLVASRTEVFPQLKAFDEFDFVPPG